MFSVTPTSFCRKFGQRIAVRPSGPASEELPEHVHDDSDTTQIFLVESAASNGKFGGPRRCLFNLNYSNS